MTTASRACGAISHASFINRWPISTALIRAVAFGLGLVIGAAAAAAASTSWNKDHASQTRLIVGSQPTDTGTAMFAGLQIKLKPGWKTYWHNPGNSGGIPPQFDWSKSVNVARLTVFYPAPERMEDETGVTFGYKNDVTFPMLVEAIDPQKPMVLRVAFHFGVCEKICVPAFSDHALDIAPGSVISSPIAISRALQAVAVGAGLPAGTTFGGQAKAPRVDGPARWSKDGKALVVTLQRSLPAASRGANSAVFVFPHQTGGIFYGVPDPVELAPDQTAFDVRLPLLVDDPKRALSGQQLTVTIRGPGGAREQAVTLPQP